MSGAGAGSGSGSGNSAATKTSSTKATVSPNTNDASALPTQKPATQLEEDDEFEDFPVEDWADEDTDVAASGTAARSGTHLWEESWDDDDTSEEFAAMLKEELKKVEKR